LLTQALASPSLTWLGREGDRETVMFSDGAGVARWLTFDRAHRLVRVEIRWADPMLGDDVEQVTYEGGKLSRVRLGHPAEELSCRQVDTPVEVEVPAGFATPRPQPRRPPQVKAEPLGGGLTLLEVEHLDNKVLYLELADRVLAFEAPLDPATGALILQTIHAAAPGKPVTTLFVRHHHPDYAGGLRAFVAEGARIVTTAGNVEYFRKLAAAPHTLAPDALAAHPRPHRRVPDLVVPEAEGRLRG
jgi:hypothetical protein